MITFALLNAIISLSSACAPATGGISKSASLHFVLSPSPRYTYSDSPAMGQTSSARNAEKNADKDLRDAILSTFAENGIPTNMATLKYEYKAPKILLAVGSRCEKPGTYIVYHGAVAYKCVEDVVAKRGKRGVNFELLAADDTTGSTDPTTVAEGQDPISTTIKPGEITGGPASPTDAPPVPNVRSEQYEISGEVIVETQMAIYESQWAMLAEKIQEKLERRRVLFTEDIIVTLL